jgi:hypothetical protein
MNVNAQTAYNDESARGFRQPGRRACSPWVRSATAAIESAPRHPELVDRFLTDTPLSGPGARRVPSDHWPMAHVSGSSLAT